jgi:hypothetical protein
MSKRILILLVLALSACQTAKIKDEKYIISSAVTELGSFGHATTGIDLKNHFATRGLPKFENKIRLDVAIVPFDKKLSKFYAAKSKYNQNQANITYIDSLPVKPELVALHLLDVTGFINEINGDHNKNILRLLSNTDNAQVVSGIAVNFTIDDITKLRSADAFYLTNNQQQKYSVALFKQGKLLENIEIRPESIVAYQLSSFCWAVDDRGNSYIADMVSGKSNCKGTTRRSIKQKEISENLFKM